MNTPQDEWRALGPATRRAVWKNTRHFRVHPDPVVSAVAARYARWYLDARPWRARTWRLAAVLVLADLFVASVVVGWLSAGPVQGGPSTGEKAAIWLAAGLIAFIIIAPYAVRQIRIIRLCRIELANHLTLQSAAAADRAEVQPPVAGWTPAAGQELSVRYDRRRVLLLFSLVSVVACFMLVTVIRQWLSGSGITPYGALCGFFAVSVLFSAVFCARLWCAGCCQATPLSNSTPWACTCPGSRLTCRGPRSRR